MKVHCTKQVAIYISISIFIFDNYLEEWLLSKCSWPPPVFNRSSITPRVKHSYNIKEDGEITEENTNGRRHRMLTFVADSHSFLWMQSGLGKLFFLQM
jgi:hypothetical protein